MRRTSVERPQAVIAKLRAGSLSSPVQRGAEASDAAVNSLFPTGEEYQRLENNRKVYRQSQLLLRLESHQFSVFGAGVRNRSRSAYPDATSARRHKSLLLEISAEFRESSRFPFPSLKPSGRLSNETKQISTASSRSTQIPQITLNLIKSEKYSSHGRPGRVFHERSLQLASCVLLGTNHSCKGTFEYEPVSQETLARFFATIGDSAAGYGGVQARVMKKNIAKEIAAPLRGIVNEVITQAEYPTQLKRAIVIPNPKTTAPRAPNDFRPISVLPTPNEVIERVSIAQLLERNELICSNQSGYRKKRTTLHSVTKTAACIRRPEGVWGAPCSHEGGF